MQAEEEYLIAVMHGAWRSACPTDGRRKQGTAYVGRKQGTAYVGRKQGTAYVGRKQGTAYVGRKQGTAYVGRKQSTALGQFRLFASTIP